ncbi:MAG TPA: VWA domain-containing protein [Acidimicrobiia bacterium]|nr:VWA domain-containing protein [Acidimicrobiia bacterium]
MSAGLLIDQLSQFAGALRGRGLVVTADQTADMARSLRLVDIAKRSQAEASLQALTVTDPSHIPIFKEEFERFFHRLSPPMLVSRNPDKTESSSGASLGLRGSVGSEEFDSVSDRAGASAVETISKRDFSELDDDDLAEARRLIMTMLWHPTDYRTRRWARSPHGRRPDMRRTLRRAVGAEGDMMMMSWKERNRKQRPLVIIADISGSMEAYSDIFLVFAHAAQRRLRDVEVFTFSTHLSRITEEMRRRDTKAALQSAAARVTGWSGGTQIGEALAEWNRHWSRRLARGGPVVLILSDGWDCGDPELLRTEMARLARSVHHVVWLNPLAARETYQPLTRGMQAVLPHVDHLLPAGSVSDFQGVVRILDSITGARP